MPTRDGPMPCSTQLPALLDKLIPTDYVPFAYDPEDGRLICFRKGRRLKSVYLPSRLRDKNSAQTAFLFFEMFSHLLAYPFNVSEEDTDDPDLSDSDSSDPNSSEMNL